MSKHKFLEKITIKTVCRVFNLQKQVQAFQTYTIEKDGKILKWFIKSDIFNNSQEPYFDIVFHALRDDIFLKDKYFVEIKTPVMISRVLQKQFGRANFGSKQYILEEKLFGKIANLKQHGFKFIIDKIFKEEKDKTKHQIDDYISKLESDGGRIFAKNYLPILAKIPKKQKII